MKDSRCERGQGFPLKFKGFDKNVAVTCTRMKAREKLWRRKGTTYDQKRTVKGS